MSLTTGARSPALESAVSKARRRLVPFLLLMYVLAFLDRVNVGFAKQSLQDAVGLSDAAFALGASIFFVSYVLLEVSSNLALHKVGAKLWMARIMMPEVLFRLQRCSCRVNELLFGATGARRIQNRLLSWRYPVPHVLVSRSRLPA